jgi:hypothetical protein
MNRRMSVWGVAVLLALGLGCQKAVFEERGGTMELDRELASRLGGETRLPLAPDGDGAAGVLQIELPEPLGDFAQGTVMMQVRSSRRIGHVDGAPRKMELLRCPGIRVELTEEGDSPRFLFYHPGGAERPVAVSQIAYLDRDQWYHVAVTWASETGLVDLFVNGWAQQRCRLPPWEPQGDRVLRLGGTLGEGDRAARIEVRNVSLHAWAMDEGQLRQSASHAAFGDGGNGVRQNYQTGLDLSPYNLTLLFEPDLGNPLPMIAEDTLFDGDRRVREPEPGQWVLEGPAEAYTADGKLTIDNLEEEGAAHAVLWLPQAFPENVLIEFEITVEREDEGLAIVFFAARPRGDPGGSIFQPGLAKRNGVFGPYIKGDIDSYHVSYLAADRRMANIRKNSGFWLVACGNDQIFGHGLGRGPHHVRILKVKNQIRIEANGKLSVAFDDDGKTYGPVLGDGYMGLRQMNQLYSAQYENLRVYEVTEK